MQTRTETDAEYGAAPRLSSGSRPLIYIAEDDDDLREALAELFAYDGFAVRAAPDGGTIFDWLFRERRPCMRLPDVIVTDHRMPGYCALDILECLVEVRWTIPVIVITAYGPELRSMARALGACAVFEKPFDPDALRRAALHCVDAEFPRQKPSRGTIPDAVTGRIPSGDA
jgi:DNA-binding NtrC family response regulator